MSTWGLDSVAALAVVVTLCVWHHGDTGLETQHAQEALSCRACAQSVVADEWHYWELALSVSCHSAAWTLLVLSVSCMDAALQLSMRYCCHQPTLQSLPLYRFNRHPHFLAWLPCLGCSVVSCLACFAPLHAGPCLPSGPVCPLGLLEQSCHNWSHVAGAYSPWYGPQGCAAGVGPSPHLHSPCRHLTHTCSCRV